MHVSAAILSVQINLIRAGFGLGISFKNVAVLTTAGKLLCSNFQTDSSSVFNRNVSVNVGTNLSELRLNVSQMGKVLGAHLTNLCPGSYMFRLGLYIRTRID